MTIGENREQLAQNEVHIWRVHLVATETKSHSFRNTLSPDELQRADRFHFERDRSRFIIAHAAMREILGSYVNAAPESVAFSYGAKGKPELSLKFAQSAIRFNLSHSRECALLAVAKDLALGVDVEFINPEFTTNEIGARYFSAQEVSILLGLSPAERTDAFFSCWTRKEAYIKAIGEGFSVSLDSFDVAFGPGVPPALLRVPRFPSEVSRWSMYDIAVCRGYAGALVIEGKKHLLRHFNWEPA